MTRSAKGEVSQRSYLAELKIAVRRVRGLLAASGMEVPGLCMPLGRTGLSLAVLNKLNAYRGGGPAGTVAENLKTLWWTAGSVNRYIDKHRMADSPMDLWAAAAFLAHALAFADFELLNV